MKNFRKRFLSGILASVLLLSAAIPMAIPTASAMDLADSRSTEAKIPDKNLLRKFFIVELLSKETK